MNRQIYINLAVKDLNKTKSFFEGLGFTFSKEFTSDVSTGMIVNDQAFVMFSTEDFFKSFFKNRELTDATKMVETSLALSATSQQDVDDMLTKVVELGGTDAESKTDDQYMYNRGFYDPDGHRWEVTYMKPQQ